MNQFQAKVISMLSIALGMFGLICGVCISQGIKLPFERDPVRMGHTVLIPLSSSSCDGETCKLPEESNVILLSEVTVTPSPHLLKPGAARRRPETVSRERAESAREDGSSLLVPGGAVWASDAALEYDPMNGEL